MGYYVKNRRLQSGSSGVVLPAGPSSQRPLHPVFGLIRYNTDSGYVEYFNGTSFVSITPGGAVQYTVDTFTGDGVTTSFNMSISVTDATQIIVFIGSVYQTTSPASYTVNGTVTITFDSAPPDGLPITVIHTVS